MKGVLHSRNLEAFQVAAQSLHFGRAAETLCITASALSQRIASLESLLSLRLFERGSANLQLTEAGERLLRYCHMTRGLQEELLHDLTGTQGVAGTVTVAGFSSVVRSVLMPCLQPLMLANPNLRVHFVVADMVELRDLLLRGHADLVVSHVPVDRCGYESVRIGSEINILIESDRADAIRDVYLDHNQSDDFSESFLRAVQADTGSIRRGFCHDIYGILDAVALGLGRGVVPVHLLTAELAVRIVDDCRRALETDVLLQYPARDYTPKALRLVIETLQRNAAGLLARNPALVAFDMPD